MSFKLIKQVYAADSSFDLSTKYTLGVGGRQVKDIYETPTDLVNVLVQNIMILGGIILFLMVIVAAFKYFQDSSKAKEESMKILKTALIGFILMFSAYWIVQIIKVITGTDIFL